jgi:predicted glycoside hydrolase/deacetylase ChbG (UPF0249 family)
MGRVVFNADDFGLSDGVNKGIIESYENGVVNSSSLMTTTSHFEDTAALISKHNLKNIGLHFNLTEGEALIKNHKTIVDQEHQFLRDIHFQKNVNPLEVIAEIEAQYVKAVNAGVSINHIDSHHHIHMSAALRKIFAAFSKKHKLPLRKINNTSRHPLKTFKFYNDTRGVKYLTSKISLDFYGEGVTEPNLIKILEENKGLDLEIMCHPGYSDLENGTYNKERELELNILTSEKIKNSIVKNTY